jgi:hypothetical protein
MRSNRTSSVDNSGSHTANNASGSQTPSKSRGSQSQENSSFGVKMTVWKVRDSISKSNILFNKLPLVLDSPTMTSATDDDDSPDAKTAPPSAPVPDGGLDQLQMQDDMDSPTTPGSRSASRSRSRNSLKHAGPEYKSRSRIVDIFPGFERKSSMNDNTPTSPASVPNPTSPISTSSGTFAPAPTPVSGLQSPPLYGSLKKRFSRISQPPTSAFMHSAMNSVAPYGSQEAPFSVDDDRMQSPVNLGDEVDFTNFGESNNTPTGPSSVLSPESLQNSKVTNFKTRSASPFQHWTLRPSKSRTNKSVDTSERGRSVSFNPAESDSVPSSNLAESPDNQTSALSGSPSGALRREKQHRSKSMGISPVSEEIKELNAVTPVLVSPTLKPKSNDELEEEMFWKKRLEPMQRDYEYDNYLRISGSYVDEPSLLSNDTEKTKERKSKKMKTYLSVSSEIRAKNRQSAIEELIESERTYIENLHILIEKFVHPIKRDRSLGVSISMASALFSNVEIICGFHEKFLNELQNSQENIGQTFVKFSDFLKMYSDYISHYEQALQVLHQLSSSASFRDFVKKTAEHPKCKNIELTGYMILPIQRIPRYQLLLGQIIKNTSPDDEHFTILGTAYAKIQKVAKHVNEMTRTFGSLTKLLEIQQKMLSAGQEVHITIVKPDRHLHGNFIHCFIWSLNSI